MSDSILFGLIAATCAIVLIKLMGWFLRLMLVLCVLAWGYWYMAPLLGWPLPSF